MTAPEAEVEVRAMFYSLDGKARENARCGCPRGAACPKITEAVESLIEFYGEDKVWIETRTLSPWERVSD